MRRPAAGEERRLWPAQIEHARRELRWASAAPEEPAVLELGGVVSRPSPVPATESSEASHPTDQVTNPCDRDFRLGPKWSTVDSLEPARRTEVTLLKT